MHYAFHRLIPYQCVDKLITINCVNSIKINFISEPRFRFFENLCDICILCNKYIDVFDVGLETARRQRPVSSQFVLFSFFQQLQLHYYNTTYRIMYIRARSRALTRTPYTPGSVSGARTHTHTHLCNAPRPHRSTNHTVN